MRREPVGLKVSSRRIGLGTRLTGGVHGYTAVIAFLVAFAAPAHSYADTPLTLGVAEQDKLGIFVAGGNLTNNKGALTIGSGNLGLATNSSFVNSGSATVGTTYQNLSTTALSTASALANSLAQTGTFSNNTISGTGSLVVVDLASITGNLTIKGNGTSNQTFIINVGSGGITLNQATTFTLSSGAIANHILFNVAGAININAASTLSGTFMTLGGAINIKGATTVTGALIGGEGITNKNTLTVKQNIFNADPMISTTPELSSFTMVALVGLCVLSRVGFDRLRRRRTHPLGGFSPSPA
jgi:hypothetical protein